MVHWRSKQTVAVFLASLELSGFKSFAHRTKLTFTRGMTAIVGPNGSGKSNVADAIRWVLGEQSMKLLRGKRAEDVIFSGSASRARLSMAEVALHFDNADGRAPVDYSELSVARRVFRDGAGEYFINQQPARLADVLLLLAKCSVGQRTYAVIGQGMADAFLSASPLERKVYFDEAAGIRQFQLKREQAASKLDRTRENLAQAQLLVNEIEPRLRSLTRSVRRLERREVVEQELHQHQRAYYSTLLSRLTAERERTEERFTDRNARVAALEKSEAGLNAELVGLVGGGSELAQLEAELGRAQAERERLVQEAARVSAERHTALTAAGKGEQAWLEQRLAALTGDRKRVAAEHTAAQQEAAASAERLASSEQKIHRSAAALEKLKMELEESRDGSEILSAGRLEGAWKQLMQEEGELLESLKAMQDVTGLPAVIRRAEQFDRSFAAFSASLTEAAQRQPRELANQLQAQILAAAESREAILLDLAEARTAHATAQQKARSLAERETAIEQEVGALERQRKRTTDPTAVAAQAKEFSAKLAAAGGQVEDIQERLRALANREEGKRGRLKELQARLGSEQGALASARAAQGAVAVERARLEQRLVDLERELREELTPEQLKTVRSTGQAEADTGAEAQTIARLKHQRDLIGGIDEGVAAEYQSTNERFQYLTHQIQDLTQAMADLETAIAELDATIKKEFDVAFEKINTLFQKYFRTLFGGGQSKLTVQRELKTAEEEPGEVDLDAETAEREVPKRPGKLERVITGIEIHANPPGKRLKSIQQLSGGERALTSIALLSAIIAHNPSPFVVLDEVDAALDEANSRRFAAILDELSKKTQFIAITHNRATMEHAHILYGVTMSDDGVSHTLSVKMEDAERAIAGNAKK